MEKLKAKAEFGFSPSLLNTYRNCQLQFYFHAIGGLREADEVEETIGADTLGNAIHEVLESFYKPFIGKKIIAADIKAMKANVDKAALGAFEKHYSSSEMSSGKNLLILKVAAKFIHNFLDAEMSSLGRAEKNGQPVMIRSLEQELEHVVEVHGQAVKVKGKADRIDSAGALTRIIDYKTGFADNSELRFDDWEEIRKDPSLAKSFQLLTYAWLFQKMNPAVRENIVSGIITFRELSAGLKTVKAADSEVLNETILAEFEEQLRELLSEIFDPIEPFRQTEDPDNCIYCAFRGICNR
jgi:ATP-dependent helicase/DNAse subunit B